MAKATYWVLAKTLWQGDSFSPIAGGFSDKAEAESIAEKEADNGVNEYGQQNLKNVVQTIVVNTTKMKRVYGWSKSRAQEEIYYIQEQEAQQEAYTEENWIF